MHAPIKWLNKYIQITEKPEELADKLTMAGLPVENIFYMGKNIENVVTGKLLDVVPHPNADKLSICTVDTGKDKRIIVTGAKNVAKGQIVPVALDGAVLPGGVTIKPSKLRGIESFGMLCSAKELFEEGIPRPDVPDGILILSQDTPVGVDIKEVLGLDDIVLEFELTANRADCFSMLGLAREIGVLTKRSVTKPMLSLKESNKEKTASLLKVSVEATELCSRFTTRVLKDVKVGPSPLWLVHSLQAAGIRSINNVVDVTNFVMLEMGQPMHAYDYSLISGHSLVVRRAITGEKLTTLDGQKRELTGDMLVIADAGQPIGIAGVMGGLATEVTKHTQCVVLEAAAFDGVSVRRTSRALGLRSEASGRFERGVDVVNVVRALDRAAKLLEEMGACSVCEGIVDVYPNVILPRQLSFTVSEINNRLGTAINKAVMVEILAALEFEVETAGDKITVVVPTWRNDVTCSADISEEIARIVGFDSIAATTPEVTMARGGQTKEQTVIDYLKDLLSYSGYSEVINYSFVHGSVFDKLNLANDSSLRQAIPLLNPITDEFSVMRTTLIGGILDTVVRNLSRKNEDLKIYEVSSVYIPEKLPLLAQPKEKIMLAGALTGHSNELGWNMSRDLVDFYDAKGTIEVLLERMGINEYEIIRGDVPYLHPGKCACFIKDGKLFASVGEVHPKVLNAYGINRPVYLFELELEKIVNNVHFFTKYFSLPKYPPVSRDLAVVVPYVITAEQIKSAIVQSGGTILKDICLFDVYEGGQVETGYKSLAFSLTFQSLEKTLTDKEVDVYVKNIIVYLERTFGAKLRN